MAPNSFTTTRRRRVVDAVPALFDHALLKDGMAVEAAMRALERHLADPAARPKDIVVELGETTHALEFALLGVSANAYTLLTKTILEQFPTTPHTFLSSHTCQLLLRFPLFFRYVDDGTALKEHNVTSWWRTTQGDIEVLKALARLSYDDSEPPVDNEFDEYGDVQFIVKRKGQKKKKQAKRYSNSPADLKTITDNGFDVPQSREEAATLVAEILETQTGYLQRYLEMFRLLPPVATILRACGVGRTDAPDSPATTAVAPDESTVVNDADTDVGDVPSLPPVLPMKAALYFDSADGFGEWRILISTRADRDLRQARRRDANTFRIFVKKIKQLSCGHFSDDNQKRLTGLDVEIPIYEAKMTGDTRLVYTVDCVPEFESNIERQVIRIFGIYTHAQLDRRFWDCMSRQLERRGAEYRKRCTFRNPPLSRGDKVYSPASWPPPAEPAHLEPVSSISDMRKEDLEELHSLLVLEKFVTFSQALLNSILADQEVAHVFDVTAQEKQIIEHPSSCFVLGRSGTGKTTTMLFKMLGIERAWESYRETMPKPRQLFVTQSRVLAEKVEEYFAKLLDSLATATQSPKELVKMAARKQQQQQQGLVDRDEEIYWRGDLPKRYGALQEENFPMFLTYDHICRLLEAEFQHYTSEVLKKEGAAHAVQAALELQDPTGNDRDGALSNDYMQQRRAKFVSFGTFLEEYWSHFPQSLTKGLDPSLVFGEFMGVIKGSELALHRPEGHLEKDTYCNLSHRTQGTFANQRECVYQLFTAYLKKKKERGEYDAADRTHALIKSLRTRGIPGDQMDFMYVDEAQDNLLIDALVLRKLCRNPHGMFWAGDTAQTISVGSAFRFNDLKSFLYNYEKDNTGTSAAQRVQPESFQLVVNYRSHAGIVNCAHSVIQLITEFWPHAIDMLAEERGMIDGLKPVFFSGWDQNTVRYEQFLFGESGSHLEFGAEQCILVRDDAARDRLRAQVGDIGLIMTLYESKGLEFNDVLLYNFFEDSTVDLSQWRVVLNALPEQLRANHPAPRFDEARHSGVCRELKFLYVAITRARKNLWIADGSEKGEPMRIVWTSKDQIQNCTPGTDVPQLAMSSTAEDWAKTALSLFNNRRYMQAMHCYERAGLPRERAVAHAYSLREVARSTRVTRGDTTAQAVAFTLAAEAFLKSAEAAVTEKRAYYRIAAECYAHAGNDYKAGQAYSSATEYTLSAQHFRKAGKFEEAVDVVKAHRDKVTATVAESIVEVSRLYFLREKQLKKARELFDTDEEALEYMDDYGLDVVRASFLEDMGRYGEAAKVQFAEGNTLDAIRLLTLDRANDASMHRAFEYLLEGLWSNLSCGLPITDEYIKTHSIVARLLRLADGLQGTHVDTNLQDEVAMFRAIAKRDTVGLLLLGQKFMSSSNEPATFLCFDYAFSTTPNLQAATLPEIAKTQETFFAYARMLQKMSIIKEPCEDDRIRKIFALRASTEDLFLLPGGSFLAVQCNGRLTPSARTTDQGTSVPRLELDRLIKHELKVRLLKRVNDENQLCRNLRPLKPCLAYAVFNQCNRGDCPRNHSDYQNYTAADYNVRVQVVLLQVLIYQTIYRVQNSEEVARQRGYWLRELDEALSPPYYKLGALHILSPESIPEWSLGLHIVQLWVRDLLDRHEPYHIPHQFVTTLLRAGRLALGFDSKAADVYLHRVPCVAAYRFPTLLRGPEKAYVVYDLIAFLQYDQASCLDRGVLFMNHILEHKIPIDIGLLCDFMDHLCGAMIFTFRLQRRGPLLDDVTLPKSWLVRLLPHAETLRTKRKELSSTYKKHMGGLLEQIYSGAGAGYLYFENRELSTIRHQIRSIFFARICKNLCLWGYNLPSWELRNDITRAIGAVRQPGRTYSPLIEEYVNARSWDALSRAVRHSAKGSTVDEMIQLHHGSKPIPKYSLLNVRRVVYTRIDDIPWLLKTAGATAPTAALRAEASPFVPTSVSAGPSQPETEEPAQTLEDLKGEEDVFEQGVDVENITQAIDAEQSKAAPPAATPEELAAAEIIATAYQRYTERNRRRKTNSAEEVRRRVFAKFLEEGLKMDWPHPYYRMLFFGPIPHLYIAVEHMKTHLHEARSVARKKSLIVQHLDLENVQSSLTQMNRLFKSALSLQQALGPTGDVHKARDIEKLKAYTIEADALMKGLPVSAMRGREEDMKIAWKAIVQVKKAPVKALKPELNTDDLGEVADF